MPSESAPYRPYGRKDRDATIKSAVDAIFQDRFEDIPDEETFRNARVQYIRKRMESGKNDKYLEQLFGELEKKWKAAQATRNKKKLEAGRPSSGESVGQRPDIMSEELFEQIYGGLSSIQEDQKKEESLPATENVPLIPYEELDEVNKEEDQEEKLKRNQEVVVKINLPINGQDKEFILTGKFLKPSPKIGDESTIIGYIGGLTEEEEKLAIENGFLRKGLMKVSNKLIYTAEKGRKGAESMEREVGVHPKDKIEVTGYKGPFRAFGVGKNSSPEKPTVIIISETSLRNGPRLEDEMEVALNQVRVIKRYTPSN